jgi:hypothetical protein
MRAIFQRAATPFVVSLSNHGRRTERSRALRSPSTKLRTGFDKLRANGFSVKGNPAGAFVSAKSPPNA